MRISNLKNFATIVIVLSFIGFFSSCATAGYIRKEKTNTAIENFEEMKRFVKNEINKGLTGDVSITTDAIGDLNAGRKKAPFGAYKEKAFAESKTQPIFGNGQVAISVNNLRELKSGETVTIFISVLPEGVSEDDWPEITSVTFTKE